MKNKNLVDSFNNAVSGIIHTIKREKNMKLHITAAVLVLVLSFFYRLTRMELLVVCAAIALVFICELLNTAIEMLMDTIVDVYHPKAKKVKDIAAGAVLVSAFFSLIAAYFIFFDKFRFDLEAGLRIIRESPVHITIIALAITIFLVLVIKFIIEKGTPFQGGMPSGHSAIAFSITTAVAFLTDNTIIVVFCLIIALLVVQSRLEAKFHTIFELIAGAVLGFLVTLLVFQLFFNGS
ncbi:MAG TPA: phosphatase PAP2 family protein [Clostridiaceae bacterium]|jgi:diacylglycerol kinase (ATP)|nr:phosphatase PAP2 family protein [Clostridiaceae bacterium]